MKGWELVGVIAKKTGVMNSAVNEGEMDVFCVRGERYDAMVVPDGLFRVLTIISTKVYKKHVWRDDFTHCKYFKPIYRAKLNKTEEEG